MRTSITLELKTREAYQLFTRKIKGDRLFIDAILNKINKVSQGENTRAIKQYQHIKMKLLELKQHIETENMKFSYILQSEELLKGKSISIRAQFNPAIEFKNSLSLDLIEVIECFDALMATTKLLFFVGSFKSSSDYYAVTSKNQKHINQILSRIISPPYNPKITAPE